MKGLLTDRTVFARRSGVLCAALFLVTGSAALGQTNSPPGQPGPPTESSAKDEPPPGACKPIGLTVSGEVVFPLECRDFIERKKAASRRVPQPETKPAPTAAEAKPVVPDDKPTGSTDKAAIVEDKPAPEVRQTEVRPAEAKPAEVKPAEVKPAESKPAEIRPAEIRPAEIRPADVKPPESQPLEGRSAEVKSSEGKPSDGKPSDGNSSEGKSAAVVTAPAPPETRPAAEAVKPSTPETRPSTAEEKPASSEEKPADRQSANAAVEDDGKPGARRPDPASRRAESRAQERSAGVPGCTHFRTYNAASGTYRDFSGRTRPCR